MTQVISGVRIFPDTHIWNTPINTLPVHANSAAYIAAIGGTSVLMRAKMSTLSPRNWGMPYTLVDSTTPRIYPTIVDYPATSYPGPYPIPASPLIESGFDQHALFLDTDAAYVYEVTGITNLGGGAWSISAGGRWNLSSNALPPLGVTYGDAAALSVLAGQITYDEVATGTITHALRVTIPYGSGTFIWPARHSDGSTAGVPPHGSRLRLKASFVTSGYSTTNQVILAALAQYGCFIADQGANSTPPELRFSGVPDNRWNDSDLDVLYTTITANDFEVVDESSLMVDPDSGGIAASAYVNYRTLIEPNLVDALESHGLSSSVQILGPDTSAGSDSWLTSAGSDLSHTLGGYARQAFPGGSSDIGGGSLEVAAKSLVGSIYANDTTNKPIVQDAMGYGAMGPGQSVATYQYGMEMADYAVQLARAGMAALIAYILDDDMHGTEWGMWQITQDTGQPRPWFFPWSLLTQTLVPGSTLYAPAQPTSNDLRVLAAQAPQGGWTFVLVNRRATTQNIQVSVPFAPVVSTALSVYAYSNATPLFVDVSGFPLASGTLNTVLPRGFTVSVAANALLILTQATATETTLFDVRQPPLQKRR